MPLERRDKTKYSLVLFRCIGVYFRRGVSLGWKTVLGWRGGDSTERNRRGKERDGTSRWHKWIDERKVVSDGSFFCLAWADKLIGFGLGQININISRRGGSSARVSMECASIHK